MISRIALTVLYTSLALALAVPLHGFEQRRPITLDVTNFEFGKLAKNFATMADAELVAPEELLATTVTLHVERVPWQTALDALCDTAGCDWGLRGRRLDRQLTLTLRPPEAAPPEDTFPGARLTTPLYFQLQQAGVQDVLAAFAEAGNFRLRIEGEVSGVLTMNIETVRLGTALDVVCQSTRCEWLIDGEELIVAPAEAHRAELPPALGEEMTMSLKDADGCEVLSAFERITKLAVEHSLQLCDRPVTIVADSLPVSSILNHLTSQWNATWRVDGQRLIIEPKEPSPELLEQKVDLDLKDAPACEVLQAVARMVEAEPPLCNSFIRPKRILMAANSLPVRELLDRLCEEWACLWQMEGGALELTPQDETDVSSRIP
ncbi:MAG: hypothetical protein AAF690_25560 [Acidobacteriota bacterium]